MILHSPWSKINLHHSWQMLSLIGRVICPHNPKYQTCCQGDLSKTVCISTVEYLSPFFLCIWTFRASNTILGHSKRAFFFFYSSPGKHLLITVRPHYQLVLAIQPFKHSVQSQWRTGVFILFVPITLLNCGPNTNITSNHCLSTIPQHTAISEFA